MSFNIEYSCHTITNIKHGRRHYNSLVFPQSDTTKIMWFHRFGGLSTTKVRFSTTFLPS